MPNTREVVPPSVMSDEPVPEKPFSISSIHSIAGAIASAVLITLRMFSSDAPTRPPKILPTSRRSSGICHSAPTALAVSDLPVPGTPISRMPLGSGSPKSRARELNALRRLTSQSLRISMPPTSRELLAVLVVLEHAALADDLLLLLEDRLEVERVRAHGALGEHVLGLDQRQAERAFDDALHERRIALDHLLRRRRAGSAAPCAQRLSISARFGSSQSSTAEMLFSSSGGILVTGERKSRLFLVLRSSVARIAQPAHHRRLLEEGVEVAQHEQRAALGAQHVIDRLHRILDVARALPVRERLEALGDRPHLEPHLALDAQLAQRLLDAILLGRA